MEIKKTENALPSSGSFTSGKPEVNPEQRTPGDCKKILDTQPKILCANNAPEVSGKTDSKSKTPVKATDIYQDNQFLNGEFRNTQLDKNSGISLVQNTDGTYPSYGEYISPPIATDFEFNEAISSWNCKTTPNTGIGIYVRACKADGNWTSWFLMGVRGNIDIDKFMKEDNYGKVNSDTLGLKSKFIKLQYKVNFGSKNNSETPVLKKMTICHTDTEKAVTIKYAEKIENFDKKLEVPFRSQRGEDKSISGRICGPTSLAMVLEYYGINLPAAKVAENSYDKFNDIYGNWPYLVACASEYGLQGQVQYFTSLDGLKEEILKGQPVIVGIAYGEGERSNAPFLPSTSDSGHMLVVRGFDKEGNVLVNDPAAPDAASGVTVYKKDEFIKAWIYKGLGVALTFKKTK